MKFKIFLSSPMGEFENERFYLKRKIEDDYVLNSFFEVFGFEETSASGRNRLKSIPMRLSTLISTSVW